jgi:uncharacterized protein (AIM24 family)
MVTARCGSPSWYVNAHVGRAGPVVLRHQGDGVVLHHLDLDALAQRLDRGDGIELAVDPEHPVPLDERRSWVCESATSLT